MRAWGQIVKAFTCCARVRTLSKNMEKTTKDFKAQCQAKRCAFFPLFLIIYSTLLYIHERMSTKKGK